MGALEGTEHMARAAIMVCNHLEIMTAAAVKSLADNGDKETFMRFIESIAMAQNHLMEVRSLYTH